MKAKFIHLGQHVGILLFAFVTLSLNLFAYNPNSTDLVDPVDYPYLQAKYAAQLSNDPSVNTGSTGGVTDLSILTAKDATIAQMLTSNAQLSGGPVRDILFIGSSTIQYWSMSPENLATDMLPLTSIVNNGLGGSVLIQQIHAFTSLVTPHQPKVVVLSCENDITTDAVDVIFDKVRYMGYKIHEAFPNAILYLVSFKTAPSTASLLETKIKPLNVLLKEYARIRPQTEYINHFDALMNADGTVNSSLYKADNLHLNSAGYQVIAPIFRIPLIQSMDLKNGKPTIVIE
ncbi:MAG: GDSL-type esterase/lipase family protein [Paludibacter sp.]|jgi:lysophospholipase L1-like esterase